MTLRRVALLVAALVMPLACSSTEVRSSIGQPCSLSTDEDPYYYCDPSRDLVCMNTDPTQPMLYKCRIACDIGDKSCSSGDVCCSGPVHGKDYGKMGGCVPRAECPTSSVANPPSGS